MTRNKTIFCLLILLFTFGSRAQQTVGIDNLEHALSAKKDTAQVNALNKLSWEYRRLDTEKALRYANRALAASEKLDYEQGKAFASKNLGAIHWLKGEYNLAQEKYTASLLLFQKLDNQAETGNLHNLFGLLRWNEGKYPEAVIHYKKASQIYEAIGDIEGKAYVFNNLGIIYYELGNLNEALNQYLQAMQIYDERHDQFALSNVYNNIGLIYSEQGNYHKALKYYRSSLRIDLENGNAKGQGEARTNIGTAFYYLNDLDQSRQNHLQAQLIFQQIQDKKGISQSLFNLAEIDFRQKQYGLAEAKWQEALAITKEIGDEQGRAMVLISLGKLRIAQRNDAQAIALLSEALTISRKVGSLKYQKEAAFHLSELHERSGQPSEALQYYKQYIRISDSIQDQLANNKLLNMQVEFETRRQEQLTELWKKESIIANGRKQALAAGIVFLAVLSLIWISRQRLKHREEKHIAELLIETQCVNQRALELEVHNMELEIEFNRRSLMAYTEKLIEKNMIVESLKAQIEENHYSSEEARQAQIGQLTYSRIVTEDDWKEFKKLYNAVYPKFMAGLEQEFPGITQAELRLAALISLKLSSREIAAILGISSDSVKKSRQRLRKKMGMEIEEGLDEALIAKLEN